MRMSPDVYLKMNNVVALCFDANAVLDNLAYSLDYHYYNRVADVVHHSMAHIMPEWADIFTTEMLKLSARPIRKPIGGYEKDYSEAEWKDIFVTIKNLMESLRDSVRDLINAADMNDDDEIRIFGENFLEGILLSFLKQAEEWVNASLVLTPSEMNIHIKEYTNFIAIKE